VKSGRSRTPSHDQDSDIELQVVQHSLKAGALAM
jgi:hypothetical protein